MNKYIVKKNITGVEGLCLIKPNLFEDNRGYFFESYNQEEFFQLGLNMKFVQDNEVHSQKGVLRGFHVNLKHPQGKLVRVPQGKIFDVVVDLRKESTTYKKCVGVELSGSNKNQLYIPEGMGHAYLALEESDVLYKVTTHYIPCDEVGFSWNSEELHIDWPIYGIQVIQSEKDRQSKDLKCLDL